MAQDLDFALNHVCAPRLGIWEFFDLAKALGVHGVEIRNDLADNAILDGTPPASVRAAAHARGLRLLSINALQRFDDWSATRLEQARELISYAAACGAEALVLVPTNDGTAPAAPARRARLRTALAALRPLLAEAGMVGLIEPLGFAGSSLRRKADAVAAIRDLDAADRFGLVHDTFHHHLAGERALFPEHTRLVHISGVAASGLATTALRDGHRGLVEAEDRLDTIGQLAALARAGLAVPLSFEPFATAVHVLAEPRAALARSMALVRAGIAAARSQARDPAG